MFGKEDKNLLHSKKDIHSSSQRFDKKKSNRHNFENEGGLADIPLKVRKRDAEKPLFLTSPLRISVLF